MTIKKIEGADIPNGEAIYGGYAPTLAPHIKMYMTESHLWYVRDVLPQLVIDGVVELWEALFYETMFLLWGDPDDDQFLRAA